MSPGFHPPYRIYWTRLALAGLADAFAAYFLAHLGCRVTAAERMIEALLADDPERNGGKGHEGFRRIVVSPLVVTFEVLPVSRAVRVASVGYFPV